MYLETNVCTEANGKQFNIWQKLCLLDGPEENSSKLLSTPFIEDPQHRLKWTAYLEFTHNHEVGDLTWDKVGSVLLTYKFVIEYKKIKLIVIAFIFL